MENQTRLHIGRQGPCILINKKTINNLRSFQLTTQPELLTTWQYSGNGPKYAEPPDDIFSNEAYPLRIIIGDATPSVNVVLLARPLGYLERIDIDLHTDRKDILHFVFTIPIHQDVRDTLVHLGVNIATPGEPSP